MADAEPVQVEVAEEVAKTTTEVVESTEEPKMEDEAPAADAEESKEKSKFDRVCPSVIKGESCWALSKGKKCHYAVHDPEKQPIKNCNVYVCQLPLTTTKEEVMEMFEPFGEIQECKLLQDPRNGNFKGVAFVHYVNEDDASSAIEAIHGLQLDGNPAKLECRLAKPNVKSGTAPRGFRDRREKGGKGYGKGGKGGYRERDDYARDGYRDGPYRSYDYYPDRGYDDYDRRGPPRQRPMPYSRPVDYYRDGPPMRGGPRDWDRPEYDDYYDAPRRRPLRPYDPYLEEDLAYPPRARQPGPGPVAKEPGFIPTKYDPYGTSAPAGATFMPPITK